MTMSIPHPIPYQGSKRRLAALILGYSPPGVRTLFEPFAGSAAVTLAAAAGNTAEHFVLGDSLDALAALWNAIILRPRSLADEYEAVWEAQKTDPRNHFLGIRDEYNRTHQPVHLLYLLARCVKNAVRFSACGEFNQSADHRRTGRTPGRMRQEILAASALLTERCAVECADYTVLLNQATPQDLVYMDPPYQGVSGSRDRRYGEQLDLERLVESLDDLNHRDVPFVLSFDGSHGEKEYGQELPKGLGLTRVLVNTGRSSQATLNGVDAQTTESIYLSPGLGDGIAVEVALSRPPTESRSRQGMLFPD